MDAKTWIQGKAGKTNEKENGGDYDENGVDLTLALGLGDIYKADPKVDSVGPIRNHRATPMAAPYRLPPYFIFFPNYPHQMTASSSSGLRQNPVEGTPLLHYQNNIEELDSGLGFLTLAPPFPAIANNNNIINFLPIDESVAGADSSDSNITYASNDGVVSSIQVEELAGEDDGNAEEEIRRCLNIECNKTETPQWRRGPLGPNTLCNACGLRYSKEEEERENERQFAAAIAIFYANHF